MAAMFRALVISIFLLALVPACGSSDGRVVPPGDVEFTKLEKPEEAGECQTNADCVVSCVWGCVPPSGGPTTCPADPLPRPARLEQASCVCDDSFVCAWYPDP